MKILMVNKFLYPNGGSETYIFKIGEYLISQGHEVQYFGMEHAGRIVGNHVECYTKDMDFHTGKLKKLFYPLQILYSADARKKMRVVLEDFEPDVVHLNNFNFQLTPSIIYAVTDYEKKHHKRVRIIYTAHDYQLICPNHMLLIPDTKELCERCVKGSFVHCTKGKCIHGSRIKSLLGSMEGYLYRMLKTYRHIDTVICPSIFMKTKLDLNPTFKNKTIALHNFIDTALTNESKRGEAFEDRGYVLYFGRFAEEKGIRTLLEVCRKCRDIPFLFAGNGPLEQEVNEAANVKNVGFQTGQDMITLIRQARFAIIPSEWYENCPFSVMEAQMYGTPVIGADIGGIPELIQVGKTGELFKAGDADHLQEKIEELWRDTKKIEQYTQNCGNITFDTLAVYCDKLIGIYKQA